MALHHQDHPPIRSADGNTLITDKTKTVERWAEHFSSVLNCPPASNRLSPVRTNETLDDPTTLPETQKALDDPPTLPETQKALDDPPTLPETQKALDDPPTLPETQKALDDPPTLPETQKAIHLLSVDKTPGSDSIPADVYKV